MPKYSSGGQVLGKARQTGGAVSSNSILGREWKFV